MYLFLLALIPLAILFPRMLRSLFCVFGLLIIVMLMYFGAGFHRWQDGCAAHASDAAYVSYHNCE